MDANRRTAIATGVLFITATAADLAGAALSQPVLSHSDYLARASGSTNQLSAAALLGFVAAITSAAIAISLYPVLKEWSAGLALGSVVFRTMEALGYTVGVVVLLSLPGLGSKFATSGTADRAAIQVVADSLRDMSDQAGVAAVIAFCLGAFIYYYLFYRSQLIPRWLSGFGMAAIALMFVACLLAWFTHNPVTGYVVLALPIALQEMVLAVWLIVKGFSAPALESKAAFRAGAAVAG